MTNATNFLDRMETNLYTRIDFRNAAKIYSDILFYLKN